jgi:TetR/AcrR family transcriptional regulator, lmrAB and yxaGH operons repressor
VARSKSREQAVETAVHLFRRQGYHGTALSQIHESSGAPRGSFYFHFPGGKRQLALEAIAQVRADLNHVIEVAEQRGATAAEMIRALGRILARWMERTGYEEGCAVAEIVLDTAPDIPDLHDACREAFDDWRQRFTAAFTRYGQDPARADRLACTVLAGIEGAFILCRSHASGDPLRTTTELLSELCP